MSGKYDYKEQLVELIQLKEMDVEIFDLTSRKDTFPVRLKEMDDSLNDKKGGIEQAEEEYKQLQVAKNEKENEMQGKEEKIKKHDGDLYQIKNNKEYQALLEEIASIKADVSLIEEDIIRLYDDIEATKAKLEEEKKIFDEEKNRVEKEKQEIKAEEQELTKKLEGLIAGRTEQAKGIAPELLAQYERIKRNRGRVALAKIENEFCGECNMQLRPQVINEAKLKQKLVFCENCARMLYEKG